MKYLCLLVLCLLLSGCSTICTRCEFWGVFDKYGTANGGPVYPCTSLICEDAITDLQNNRGPWTKMVMPTGIGEPCSMDYVLSGCMLIELPIAVAVDTVFLVPDYIYSLHVYLH